MRIPPSFTRALFHQRQQTLTTATCRTVTCYPTGLKPQPTRQPTQHSVPVTPVLRGSMLRFTSQNNCGVRCNSRQVRWSSTNPPMDDLEREQLRAEEQAYSQAQDPDTLAQQLATAEEELEARLRLSPKDPETHFLMGRLWLMKGNPENSVEWLNKAIEFSKDIPDLLLECHSTLATVYLKALRKFPEAKTHFDAALGIEPHYPEALEGYILACRENGDLSDAETTIRAALVKYPHNPSFYWLLGSVLEDIAQQEVQYKPELAETAFNAAIRAYEDCVNRSKSPDAPQAILSSGAEDILAAHLSLSKLLLIACKDKDRAEKLLRDATKLITTPHHNLVWCSLGQFLERFREDWAGAAKAFSKAAESWNADAPQQRQQQMDGNAQAIGLACMARLRAVWYFRVNIKKEQMPPGLAKPTIAMVENALKNAMTANERVTEDPGWLVAYAVTKLFGKDQDMEEGHGALTGALALDREDLDGWHMLHWVLKERMKDEESAESALREAKTIMRKREALK
eukprot:TRINITY_DN67176_c10_g3_i1.p1 TRINITY_DN67176_c10_g3~~TRINITY_DN67176_c10_g3_i1.p1  ORF type:complete len:513 (-),score=46.93 TRINITY_DN67176_c10_g3_i1:534-2072(-)